MEQPNMMTVREIARTGLLSEHALRLMLKAGKLPAIYIGKKALINYDTTTIMATPRPPRSSVTRWPGCSAARLKV